MNYIRGWSEAPTDHSFLSGMDECVDEYDRTAWYQQTTTATATAATANPTGNNGESSSALAPVTASASAMATGNTSSSSAGDAGNAASAGNTHDAPGLPNAPMAHEPRDTLNAIPTTNAANSGNNVNTNAGNITNAAASTSGAAGSAPTQVIFEPHTGTEDAVSTPTVGDHHIGDHNNQGEDGNIDADVDMHTNASTMDDAERSTLAHPDVDRRSHSVIDITDFPDLDDDSDLGSDEEIRFMGMTGPTVTAIDDVKEEPVESEKKEPEPDVLEVPLPQVLEDREAIQPEATGEPDEPTHPETSETEDGAVGARPARWKGKAKARIVDIPSDDDWLETGYDINSINITATDPDNNSSTDVNHDNEDGNGNGNDNDSDDGVYNPGSGAGRNKAWDMWEKFAQSAGNLMRSTDQPSASGPSICKPSTSKEPEPLFFSRSPSMTPPRPSPVPARRHSEAIKRPAPASPSPSPPPRRNTLPGVDSSGRKRWRTAATFFGEDEDVQREDPDPSTSDEEFDAIVDDIMGVRNRRANKSKRPTTTGHRRVTSVPQLDVDDDDEEPTTMPSDSLKFKRDASLPHVAVGQPKRYHVVPRAPVRGCGGEGAGCTVLHRDVRAKILQILLGNAQDEADPVHHISLLYPHLYSAAKITKEAGANADDEDEVLRTAANFQLYAAGYFLQNRLVNSLSSLPVRVQGNIMDLLLGMKPSGNKEMEARHMEHIRTLWPVANSWAAITHWVTDQQEDMNRVSMAAAWFRRNAAVRVAHRELLG